MGDGGNKYYILGHKVATSASNHGRGVFTVSQAIPSWYQLAAEKMVREQVKLPLAAASLDIKLTPGEADKISSSKDFQRVLRRVKNEFYREIVTDPTHGKEAAMGRMMIYADNLAMQGDWDKAAEVILKLGKLANWVQPETNVSVLGNLTSKDLESIKQGILDRQRQQSSSTPAGSS